MVIRDLTVQDYEGFLEAIAALAIVNVNEKQFQDIYDERQAAGIRTIVCLDAGKVVGTASCFIEKKFLHDGGKVMHVEDVAVRQDCQIRGIGRAMMDFLADYARLCGCYKIILDCSNKNAPFYEKCGYHVREIEMRKDLI